MKKPFAVMWDNECGYGTDYFETEREQSDFIADCQKHCTNAIAALTKDLPV